MASLNHALEGDVPVAVLPMGTLIPGEVNIYTVKNLVAEDEAGTYRIIALADADNEIAEYSEGNNHGSLMYRLNAVIVTISIGSEGAMTRHGVPLLRLSGGRGATRAAKVVQASRLHIRGPRPRSVDNVDIIDYLDYFDSLD